MLSNTTKIKITGKYCSSVLLFESMSVLYGLACDDNQQEEHFFCQSVPLFLEVLQRK